VHKKTFKEMKRFCFFILVTSEFVNILGRHLLVSSEQFTLFTNGCFMYLGCVATNDGMWKETVVALSHHSLRGTEDHHRKFQSVRPGFELGPSEYEAGVQAT
jgi:hypothetical protein